MLEATASGPLLVKLPLSPSQAVVHGNLCLHLLRVLGILAANPSAMLHLLITSEQVSSITFR